MLILCIRFICNKGLTQNFGIGPRLSINRQKRSTIVRKYNRKMQKATSN